MSARVRVLSESAIAAEKFKSAAGFWIEYDQWVAGDPQEHYTCVALQLVRTHESTQVRAVRAGEEIQAESSTAHPAESSTAHPEDVAAVEAAAAALMQPYSLHLVPTGEATQQRPLRSGTAVSESSTAHPEDPIAVETAVAALMQTCPTEDLEPGADTPLVAALYELVHAHGTAAILELGGSIESREMDPQMAGWVLRWLGRLRDHTTHSSRRWLLCRGLRSPVPMIRDGAAAGLASLGDDSALADLQAAANSERYSRVRRNIYRAIQQIERSTQR